MKSLNEKVKLLRELTGKVVKSKENKFLKNHYADLNSIMETTDEAIAEAGLIWVDSIDDEHSVHRLVDVETGDSIESRIRLYMAKQDPQAFGSALSYNRRYARLAMLNLQQVDDDGAAGSGQSFIKPKQIKRINELLLQTDTKADKFLAHYRVDSVKDLYELTAQDAIHTLELKLKKMKGNDNGTGAA